MTMPPAVAKQTAEGAAASSPVAQFASDAIVRTVGGFVSGAMMYRAYSEWCKQANQRKVTSTKFGREMTRLKFQKEHSRTGSTYLDVEVQPEYLPWDERRTALFGDER